MPRVKRRKDVVLLLPPPSLPPSSTSASLAAAASAASATLDKLVKLGESSKSSSMAHTHTRSGSHEHPPHSAGGSSSSHPDGPPSASSSRSHRPGPSTPMSEASYRLDMLLHAYHVARSRGQHLDLNAYLTPEMREEWYRREAPLVRQNREGGYERYGWNGHGQGVPPGYTQAHMTQHIQSQGYTQQHPPRVHSVHGSGYGQSHPPHTGSFSHPSSDPHPPPPPNRHSAAQDLPRLSAPPTTSTDASAQAPRHMPAASDGAGSGEEETSKRKRAGSADGDGDAQDADPTGTGDSTEATSSRPRKRVSLEQAKDAADQGGPKETGKGGTKGRDKEGEANDPSYRPAKGKGAKGKGKGKGVKGKPSLVERQWAAKKKALGLDLEDGGSSGGAAEGGGGEGEAGAGAGAGSGASEAGASLGTEQRPGEAEGGNAVVTSGDGEGEGQGEGGVEGVKLEDDSEGRMIIPTIQVDGGDTATTEADGTPGHPNNAALETSAPHSPSQAPASMSVPALTPAATPAAVTAPQSRRLKGEITAEDVVQIQKSASYWNSLLVSARKARGPQWDFATQMHHVDRFSHAYYSHMDKPPREEEEEEEQVETEAETKAAPDDGTKGAMDGSMVESLTNGVHGTPQRPTIGLAGPDGARRKSSIATLHGTPAGGPVGLPGGALNSSQTPKRADTDLAPLPSEHLPPRSDSLGNLQRRGSMLNGTPTSAAAGTPPGGSAHGNNVNGNMGAPGLPPAFTHPPNAASTPNGMQIPHLGGHGPGPGPGQGLSQAQAQAMAHVMSQGKIPPHLQHLAQGMGIPGQFGSGSPGGPAAGGHAGSPVGPPGGTPNAQRQGSFSSAGAGATGSPATFGNPQLSQNGTPGGPPNMGQAQMNGVPGVPNKGPGSGPGGPGLGFAPGGVNTTTMQQMIQNASHLGITPAHFQQMIQQQQLNARNMGVAGAGANSVGGLPPALAGLAAMQNMQHMQGMGGLPGQPGQAPGPGQGQGQGQGQGMSMAMMQSLMGRPPMGYPLGQAPGPGQGPGPQGGAGGYMNFGAQNGQQGQGQGQGQAGGGINPALLGRMG